MKCKSNVIEIFGSVLLITLSCLHSLCLLIERIITLLRNVWLKYKILFISNRKAVDELKESQNCDLSASQLTRSLSDWDPLSKLSKLSSAYNTVVITISVTRDAFKFHFRQSGRAFIELSGQSWPHSFRYTHWCTKMSRMYIVRLLLPAS